jgi:hypothetical protein
MIHLFEKVQTFQTSEVMEKFFLFFNTILFRTILIIFNSKIMSNKLTIVSDILDHCSKEHLHSVFASLTDLPSTSTKAEMISYCLNHELGAYGFKSYPSPDKSMVLINDETMWKIVDFLNQKGFTPHFTEQQVERIKTIQKVASDNNVGIYWSQEGFRRNYYYFKQYGFNGINLYNILNLNTANSAAAAISSTGAAGLTMAGVIALSWSGSLFLSTLENYIPNNMVRTKAVISGAKFATAFPIRLTEWTSNQIFGFVEKIVIGIPLPTNVTHVYRLNVGPQVDKIFEIKRSAIKWLLKHLE